MIETVTLSERARTQLLNLKRRTGLEHWNVLCRWAFCLSLAEKTIPPDEDIPADSSIEMSWRVFTGAQEHVYWALLVARAKRDGIVLNRENLLQHFRLHLHRGISYLNSRANLKSIADLVGLSLQSRRGHR